MTAYIGFVDNIGTYVWANRNMLERIRDCAVLEGWTVLRYDTSADVHELILHSTGISTTEDIYIGFRSYQSDTSDYYNLSVAGFTGYVAGNSFVTQPGYAARGVCAHNNRIDYWMNVNLQRIALGMRVGSPSVYEMAYVGKMFPFAKPTQYPYPLVVGGMLTSAAPATRFSDLSHSMYAKGNRANMLLRFVDGSWIQPWCWPWGQSSFAQADNQLNLRDTNNVWTLQPILLNDNGANNYGVLDGVYQITGFNNGSENTLTIGGKDYVVLGDVWRTGFGDYIAMELD